MKLGLLADIHEDIIRLNESIEILNDFKVDEIINLGDFVGFCVPYYSYLRTRDANKVVSWLKENCQVSIAGNHDLYAIRKVPVNSDAFEYLENWYDLDYDVREKYTDKRIWLYENDELSPMLNAESKNYIRSLPEYLVKEYGSYNILFSHYGYPDITGCLTAKIREVSNLKPQLDFMKRNNCLYGFSGHDHNENITILTEDEKIELDFNEKYILPDKPLWLTIPCVANGTKANGLAIFDTDTREIVAIPLNTPPHVVEE